MLNFKSLILFLLIINCFNCKLTRVEDSTAISSLTDDRDGQKYRVMVLKDDNVWMAENLNHFIENSWCYNDSAANCSIYGRLYDWPTAMKSCPQGWRIPSEIEWRNMIDNYRYSAKDTLELISESKREAPFWNSKERSTIFKNLVSIGFIKGKGGVREPYGDYINFGITEQFWTSTIKGYPLYYNYQFQSPFKVLKARAARNFKTKESGLFCRCIKEK